MKATRNVIVFAALLTLVAVPTFAAQMFMSASTAAAELKKCDTLHHEQTCDRYHVVGTADPADDPVAASTGTVLRLDDGHFQIDWMGVGYKLDDGSVIARASDASGLGEQWVQVWPERGPVEVNGWTDTDGSSYLTVGDTLTVSGMPMTIDDQRLYLWVTPVL